MFVVLPLPSETCCSPADTGSARVTTGAPHRPAWRRRGGEAPTCSREGESWCRRPPWQRPRGRKLTWNLWQQRKADGIGDGREAHPHTQRRAHGGGTNNTLEGIRRAAHSSPAVPSVSVCPTGGESKIRRKPERPIELHVAAFERRADRVPQKQTESTTHKTHANGLCVCITLPCSVPLPFCCPLLFASSSISRSRLNRQAEGRARAIQRNGAKDT
jgi:hypothetical protein